MYEFKLMLYFEMYKDAPIVNRNDFKERFINNLHEDTTLKVYNFIR